MNCTYVMLEPATAAWDVNIGEADFAKLNVGFEPRDQDDKGHIWSTEESHNSNILVNYGRAGKGNKLHILHVRPNDGDCNTGTKIIAMT
jgi:hypothetical protein